MSAPWGQTRDTVTTWCTHPIAWGGKRDGYRTPPKLTAGDARKITLICWPNLKDVDGDRDILDLAGYLDDGLGDLQDARDGGNREEISAAREDAEGYLDEWYGALRKALHPEAVAAEDAALGRLADHPLTGLGT